MNDKRNKDAEGENVLGIFRSIGWFFYWIWTFGCWLCYMAFLVMVQFYENVFVEKPKINKAKFWGQVQTCLVNFHDLSNNDAWELISAAQHTLDVRDTTFYHRQPFDVANDLTGKNIRLSPEDYQNYVHEILRK